MADVDIGEELLKAVRADFRKELGDNDSKLAKILHRIQGTDKRKKKKDEVDLHDTALFAKECGAALSEAIAKNVTPDRLPNGQLYYNIAETILRATLRDNYELVNMVAQAAQEQTDNKLNIHLAPQQAAFPEERVHKIINAAADQTADSDTIKRRLDSPVRNVTESFYDDFVEENAKFRDEAGLKTYIVRQTNGKCCNWCASLAGRYLYEDAPDNVFAKHDNCSCTCEYISDRYRQDVWSKRRYVLSSEQRKAILENTLMPTRFTKEQAENLQNNILNGVANSGGSGIIKSKEVQSPDERSKDYRPVVLSEQDTKSVVRQSGTFTAYRSETTVNDIYISEGDRDIKRKELHQVDTQLTEVLKIMGVSGRADLPTIYIVNSAEMNKNAVAAYRASDNALFIDSAFAVYKKDNPPEAVQGFACPKDSRSTFLHELFHWKDAQDFRDRFGEITPENYTDYENYVQAQAKYQLDLLQGRGNNIFVSEYAKRSYRDEMFDETYAEYRVSKVLGG